MAIIHITSLFNWQDSNEKSDLERLELVINYLPDEKLMRTLETKRSNGRNDYPIRAIWNSLLAGTVFQHKSIESLRRELARNAELRQLCGFDPMKGANAVPTAWSYTRFLNQLLKHEHLINEIFHALVDELKNILPDFGERLAIDSKAIKSAGKPTKKPDGDRRRDNDADHGRKEYNGVTPEGKIW